MYTRIVTSFPLSNNKSSIMSTHRIGARNTASPQCSNYTFMTVDICSFTSRHSWCVFLCRRLWVFHCKSHSFAMCVKLHSLVFTLYSPSSSNILFLIILRCIHHSRVKLNVSFLILYCGSSFLGCFLLRFLHLCNFNTWYVVLDLLARNYPSLTLHDTHNMGFHVPWMACLYKATDSTVNQWATVVVIPSCFPWKPVFFSQLGNAPGGARIEVMCRARWLAGRLVPEWAGEEPLTTVSTRLNSGPHWEYWMFLMNVSTHGSVLPVLITEDIRRGEFYSDSTGWCF